MADQPTQDPYPEYMRKSIEKVNASRSRRMTEEFPRLSADQKSDILKSFHPDHRVGKMVEIKVGASKGEKAPQEVEAILQAYSRLDPEAFDLSKIDYDVDVLVIGGGGAGSAAALMAQEAGAKVMLVTKLRLGDANTMMAQGGIQAADKDHDSPTRHYLDVMGGGGYHNLPELVRALVLDAPVVMDWLQELGTMFDKRADGTYITIHGGGTSRKRMHAARDYSGAEIMRTLRDEVKNRGIQVLEFTAAIELLKDDQGKCAGAVLYNMETEEHFVCRAKTTVVATGGAGRLHVQGFPTTNHYGATADGLVLAYRAGAPFIYMDAIQYHPTGSIFPAQIEGLLVTEKVRGLGAQLVNADGEQFIFPLETRDVVSSAIIRECKPVGEKGRAKGLKTLTGRDGVWLDSPMIELKHGAGTVQKELPAMHRQYKRCNIDMTKDPILIYPTQHYQNGGIRINSDAESGVANLYIAGEASGGVHGRNRLMGNSLLDILVFGRRAGKNAAERSKKTSIGRLTLAHVGAFHRELRALGVAEDRLSPMLLPDYRTPETKERQKGQIPLAGRV
ncbi:MAG TPA: FAD-dependent oxidoreductase [bacterium]|nr:FAD-dependent oxidoreductase [bacterium]